MRFPDIPSTSIKLMLFPFSLEGSARIWLEKEPPRSILTWDDLVSKFINQFFPPSKTKNLRNKITRFQQRFDESFDEAMGSNKCPFRACLHMDFSELHQLDTFYNSLNTNDQDALDSAAGGNFLDKMPRDGLAIIESKSKVPYSRNHAIEPRASMNAHLSTSTPSNSFEFQQLAASLEDKMDIRMSQLEKMISEKNVTTPATVKTVKKVCVTCVSNFYQAPTQQMQGVSKTDFENYVKANDAVLRNMQNQGQGLQNQMTNLTEMLSKFITSNTASSSNSETLPSQTVTNPREHVNAITTRSGRTCEGPSTLLVHTPVVSIPSKEPKQNPETSMDKVQKPSSESTAQVPPSENQDSISNQKQRKSLMLKFKILILQDLIQIGLKDALVAMPKFNKWLRSLLRNKEKLEEIAIITVNVECSAIIMNKVPEKLEDLGKILIPCALQELDRTSALANSGASINLLPHSIYKQLRLGALKPTRMTLELANCSITHPMGIAEDVVVRVDGFTFLADFVVVNFVPNPR
ncbi:reverse transcriptase domain-containing protein, partial [Tanacetum coccineum]